MRENTGKKRLTPGKWAALLMAIVVFIVAVVYGGYYWLSRSYPATATAVEAAVGTGQVEVDEEDEYFHIFRKDQKENPGQGIIFYPGARVEEEAYCPMLNRFADCGYEVYLMKMPLHMAFLKGNAADLVIRDDHRKWILMGHSLGGTYAARYAAQHRQKVSGLVLLAAYSAADLSDTGIHTLSIYGSEDKILNMTRYKEAEKKLPEDTEEHVISGGNHSGFGYYGEQPGDGKSEITAREQQEEVVDMVTTEFPAK